MCGEGKEKRKSWVSIFHPFFLGKERDGGYTGKPPLIITAEVKEHLHDDLLIFDSLEGVYQGNEKSKEFATLLFGREITEEDLVDKDVILGTCDQDGEDFILLIYTTKEETRALLFNSLKDGKMVRPLSLSEKMDHSLGFFDLGVRRYFDFHVLEISHRNGTFSSGRTIREAQILPVYGGEPTPINKKYFKKLRKMRILFENFPLLEILPLLEKEKLFFDDKKTLETILKIGSRVIAPFSSSPDRDVTLVLKSEMMGGSVVEFPMEFHAENYYYLRCLGGVGFYVEGEHNEIIFDGGKCINKFLLLLERREVSLHRMYDGGKSLLNFVVGIVTTQSLS